MKRIGLFAGILAILISIGSILSCLSPNPGNKKPSDVFVVYGKLEYRPVDSTRKSMAAYTGAEFFLSSARYHNSNNPFDPQRIVLRPTDDVSAEDLRAFDGKQITISIRYTEGTLPDPRSSYPTNSDGSPVRQGEGWQVLAIIEGL
ncbi:MAG: hypothetical protein KDK37_00045 [Leptospiraceae bacterium]|nr:hypothetical protein [Leptospiraceae bacterium]